MKAAHRERVVQCVCVYKSVCVLWCNNRERGLTQEGCERGLEPECVCVCVSASLFTTREKDESEGRLLNLKGKTSNSFCKSVHL